jgi:hypothetical protein
MTRRQANKYANFAGVLTTVAVIFPPLLAWFLISFGTPMIAEGGRTVHCILYAVLSGLAVLGLIIFWLSRRFLLAILNPGGF